MELPGHAPHPNLVQLLTYEDERGPMCVKHSTRRRCAIVMELCECNLEQFRSATAVCVPDQLELLGNVAAGCAWIVCQGGIHGNLKMQNVLIAKTQDAVTQPKKRVAKVADFGCGAHGADVDFRDFYMAPEALLGRSSEKSDVYSFGHIMLRTFCPGSRQVPTQPELAEWLAGEWKSTHPCLPSQLCEAAASWICKSVDACPDNRPSFTRARERLSLLQESAERCCMPARTTEMSEESLETPSIDRTAPEFSGGMSSPISLRLSEVCPELAEA
eukprot:6490105-Amphidinium_carterae.1